MARETIEETTDELYGLPPAEFTRARDERAKALRKEGRRDEADAVKALRKPTVAAWALNQLARRRPKAVEQLLAVGERLRAAQEELLAGGDRKSFQSAAASERDEVAKLTGEATELVSKAGERAGPSLREKIAETLHAAALDEETAAELRAGRLVREREAIGGFGGMASASAPARRGSPANESKRRAPRAGKAATARRDAAERRDEARRQAEAEKREASAQRQRLAAARTDERHARRELDAAAKAVEHAQARAEAAKAHAEEATERARTTADRLKEARRAQAAAKKAHARAERALGDAGRGA